MKHCDRTKLAGFLSNSLDIDDKLEVLFHLEDCTECWEEVYNSAKAQHPHYYKNAARRMKVAKKETEGFSEEKVFEVA